MLPKNSQNGSNSEPFQTFIDTKQEDCTYFRLSTFRFPKFPGTYTAASMESNFFYNS